MSMTVKEARSEIVDLFQKASVIEAKYPDGIITNPEDEREVKRLLTEVDGLEEKLATLETTEARRDRIQKGLDSYRQAAENTHRPYGQQGDFEEEERKTIIDPGRQFIRDAGYLQLKNNGTLESSVAKVQFAVNMQDGTSLFVFGREAQMKTLVYSGGSDIMENDRRPGVVDLRQRELSVLDLIQRIPTGRDTIEYIKEDSYTNNAATVAEATATTGSTGLKPESALVLSVQTSPIRTVAHWIPVTNQMLADAPAIRGIINQRLLIGLALETEDQILTGDGTGSNLTGLLATPGTNIQGKGADNEVDAIFKGRTQVRVNGRSRPNAIVIHPNDWQTIRLMRENTASATLGNYLLGPPSAIGATTLWGMPVVESEGVTENTVLVGDFAMGASMFDRERSAIRVGTVDDQFIRNMQTILGESRIGFVVWRPAAFTRVTGV